MKRRTLGVISPLALSTSLLLSGCLILPGGERTPPPLSVEGEIFHEAKPFASEAIFIGFSNREISCSRATSVANTDLSGKFSSIPEFDGGSWRVVPLAPSSPTYFVTVCAASDGAPDKIFVGEYYGMPPTFLSLQCDLGKLGAAQMACETQKASYPDAHGNLLDRG